MSRGQVMTPKRRKWAMALAVFGFLAAGGIYVCIRPADAHTFNAALAGAGVLIGLLVALAVPPPRNLNSARNTAIFVLVFGLCILGFGIWNPHWLESSVATALLTLGSAIVAAIGGVFAGSL